MNHLPKRPTGSFLVTLLLPAFLAAACGAAATPSATVTPEPSPTPAPEPSAWLLGYGDEGLTLYDAATGERTDLALPPLWLSGGGLRGTAGAGRVGGPP